MLALSSTLLLSLSVASGLAAVLILPKGHQTADGSFWPVLFLNSPERIGLNFELMPITMTFSSLYKCPLGLYLDFHSSHFFDELAAENNDIIFTVTNELDLEYLSEVSRIQSVFLRDYRKNAFGCHLSLSPDQGKILVMLSQLKFTFFPF